MKQCVQELSIKNVVFIADKGFFRKKNIADLKDNVLYFIIPLYRNKSLIDYSPLTKENLKKKNNYFSYQGRIIWCY